MLKSTHQPLRPPPSQEPLPPAWSQHTAPTGHTYYYNHDTKQSTYQRPQPTPTPFHAPPVWEPNPHQNFPAPHAADPTALSPIPRWGFHQSYDPSQPYNQNDNSTRFQHQARPNPRERRQPQDRPKTKHAIPGCAPWLLIKTRLGRRFVHNPDTMESFWKIPKDVIGGVMEFDVQEIKRKQVQDEDGGEPEKLIPKKGEGEDGFVQQNEVIRFDEGEDEGQSAEMQEQPAAGHSEQSDDYEIEEVIEEDDESDHDDENPSKRQKGDGGEAGNRDHGFTEEDMARQLAAMGQAFDDEPEDYDIEQDGKDYTEAEDAEWEGEADELAVSESDAANAFKDLLTDHHVSPFTTWDQLLSNSVLFDKITEDYRYTLVSTTKARKEIFSTWSSERAEQAKAQKARQETQNPKIPYLALLQKHATPRLFWPEFKRKFKREPGMKDLKLSDKEREKLYREHVNRITKQSESSLKDDLRALLRSVPPARDWNCRTSVDGPLPSEFQADIRYISLKPSVRDSVIEKFIGRELPEPEGVVVEGEKEELSRRKEERRKQEGALRERQRMVEETRERRQRDVEYNRRDLEREERELQRALRVGREGLKAHLGE